jgi:hypothetical protein
VRVGIAAALVAVGAGGCTLSQGGGTPVSLPTVAPQATTTFGMDEDVVDAYVAPAKAGGAVVFHATVSNATQGRLELLSVSAATGTARVDAILGPGLFATLGPGVVLGSTPRALGFGAHLQVTLRFSPGGPVSLSVPVGGTAAP